MHCTKQDFELFIEHSRVIICVVSVNFVTVRLIVWCPKDADSYPVEGAGEKKEGAFCVWTLEEMKELLNETIPGARHAETPECWNIEFQLDSVSAYIVFVI